MGVCNYNTIDLSRIELTRGSGGQNTVIYMKFSTRASSSFLYVYSLARNAERSIHEFLIFLCRQFSDVVRQTTLKKYIPMCV